MKSSLATSAHNLGEIFDKIFTFCSHISVVCSSCFHHIQDLQRIHCYLDLDSAISIATALLSRLLQLLRLCTLSSIADTNLDWVYNRSARVATHSPPFTRSVPLLHSLHCLPVKFRISFKISLPAYKLITKIACLSSLRACSITSLSFTEIKQTN